MADRTYGWIALGGVLLEQDIEGLCDAIRDEAVYSGFDGAEESSFEPKSIEQILDACESIPGMEGKPVCLVLSDQQAIGGTFENIETFCVEHKIDFDRYSSALYSYAPEAKKFRKDMEPIETITDEDGDNVVCENDVRNAVKLLKEGHVAIGIDVLDNILSPEAPPLQKLIIKMKDGTMREPHE